MTQVILETVFTGLQVTVYLLTLFGAIRLLRRDLRSMIRVYFCFAVFSGLMSVLYWLAYDLLKMNARMPFAANEFGEAALSLLLASMLNMTCADNPIKARREIVLTGIFALASAGLWICWNGDWIEALLTGPVYAYFLCACARSLRRAGVLSEKRWNLTAVCAFAVLVLQFAEQLWPKTTRLLDLLTMIVAFGLTLHFLWILRALRRSRAPAKQRLVLAACIYAWTMSTMYMSTGGFYLAAETINLLMVPVMYLQLRRGEEL